MVRGAAHTGVPGSLRPFADEGYVRHHYYLRIRDALDIRKDTNDIGSPYPFARYRGIVRFAKVFRGSQADSRDLGNRCFDAVAFVPSGIPALWRRHLIDTPPIPQPPSPRA